MQPGCLHVKRGNNRHIRVKLQTQLHAHVASSRAPAMLVLVRRCVACLPWTTSFSSSHKDQTHAARKQTHLLFLNT